MSSTIDRVLAKNSKKAVARNPQKPDTEKQATDIPDSITDVATQDRALERDIVTEKLQANVAADSHGNDSDNDSGNKKAAFIESAPMPVQAKSSPTKNKKSLPWNRYAIRVLAVICAIIVWNLCSVYDFNFIVSFENIPTPTVVGEHFMTLLGTSEFYTHILVSLKRILIGFFLASLLGIIAGVSMGRSQVISDIIMPYIEILRPIPAVAWIPLAILMMPTEESSIIYITFLGAFFPVVLNTVHGVEQTEETLVRAAKSLGASPAAILWHVILPGALPSIMAGLAIGMGVSWFSLLAGEIISGQYGIGYFTWNSYTLVEYPNIIVGMLVIGGLGTLSTWLVKQASKPALRWQEHNQR